MENYLQYILVLIFAGAIWFFRTVVKGLEGYIGKKFELVAQKEEIERLTSIVEGVKLDNLKVLEEVRKEHQILISREEREKNMKRDIYLDALGAIFDNQILLLDMGDFSFSLPELKKRNAVNLDRISKIHLVGTEETLNALMKYLGFLGEANLVLFPNRDRLFLKKKEMESQTLVLDRKDERLLELQSAIENCVSSRESDFTVLNKLKVETQYWLNEVAKQQNKLRGVARDFQNSSLLFQRDCTEHFFGISPLISKVVLEMRKEIDLDICEDVYIDLYNSHTERGKQVVSEFLSGVESRIS